MTSCIKIFGTYCNILHLTHNLTSCIQHLWQVPAYCNILHAKFFTRTAKLAYKAFSRSVTSCIQSLFHTHRNTLHTKSLTCTTTSWVKSLIVYKVFHMYCKSLRTKFFILVTSCLQSFSHIP